MPIPTMGGMWHAILIASMSLGILARNEVENTRHVDMMEVNHVSDRCGRFSYTQVIFYKRFDRDIPGSCGWVPHGYVIVDQYNPGLPTKINGRYRFQFVDSGNSRLRNVESTLYRETWSSVDAEAEAAKAWGISTRTYRLFDKMTDEERKKLLSGEDVPE